eukprot:scaffold6322_cov59-Cylindrotheca_fusiformis.AAC.4
MIPTPGSLPDSKLDSVVSGRNDLVRRLKPRFDCSPFEQVALLPVILVVLFGRRYGAINYTA